MTCPVARPPDATELPRRAPSRPLREQLRAAGYTASVEYISEQEFVGDAGKAVASLKRAQVPPQHAERPHEYLKELNHVRLVEHSTWMDGKGSGCAG